MTPDKLTALIIFVPAILAAAYYIWRNRGSHSWRLTAAIAGLLLAEVAYMVIAPRLFFPPDDGYDYEPIGTVSITFFDLFLVGSVIFAVYAVVRTYFKDRAARRARISSSAGQE